MNAFVYMLLYGLIFFFLLSSKSAGRFFPGANSDLFIDFFFFPQMYLLSF